MTREEAIDIIKCLTWHTRPDEEDVEQAIKALEQESKTGQRIIKLTLYYKFGEYKELKFNELTALMVFLTDLMNRYGNGKEKLLLGYRVDLNY